MAIIKIHHETSENLSDELRERYTVIFDHLTGSVDSPQQNLSSIYVQIDKLKLDNDVEAMMNVLREIKKLRNSK
jgi:hypothetical protein